MLVAATVLSSCRGEGSVRLRFVIGGDLPSDLSGLFFHAEVRDAADAVLGGAVTDASFDQPLALAVAHGEGRVARLEVRDGRSAETSAVLGYGVSEPFALEVGRDAVVEVAIPMRRVPRIVALSVAGARGAVGRPDVTLEVESDRAGVVQAIVAQDPSLSFRRAVVALDADATTHVLPYDLELDCANTGGCGDGARAVFVRLIDDAGYASSSTSTPVLLDTTPPAVLADSAFVGFTAPGALVAPTAAGVGVTVRLTFAFNEAVTSTPTVELADSGLPFVYRSNEFGAWIFERVVTAEDPRGVQRPLVTATDLAGNAAPFRAPQLEYVVDDEAPAPPPVDDVDAIVYERAPWGTYDDPTPRYVVRGDAGAVEPGTRIVVYDRVAAVVGGVEVANRAGVATAEADGGFEVVLTPFDRPDVFVLLVDPSGNLHEPTGRAARVRNGVLTIPAETAGIGPPTEVFTAAKLPASLRTDDVDFTPSSDTFGLAAEDGDGPGAEHVLRWSTIAPVTSDVPDAVRLAAATYDPVRARSVMYGGRYGDSNRRETWEWDGVRWSRVVAGGDAPVCDDGTAGGEEPFGLFAHHGLLGKSVLLCRRLDPNVAPPQPSGSIDELAAFGWDGARWAELAIDPTSRPLGRNGHAVTYDPDAGAMLMFGGNASSLAVAGQFGTDFDDTWYLEATTSTSGPALRWVEQMPPGPLPPARDRHGLVHMPGVGVVLFGGIASDRDRAALDDLWVWDGERWNEAPRSTPWPAARACHAMVYDPEANRVGVLGGVTSEPDQRCLREPGLDDAWWWDGVGWTRTATKSDTPSGSGVVAFTHGERRDVMAVRGGALTGTATTSSTWRVDDRWFERTPTDREIPGDRFVAYGANAAAFYPRLDATVVHTSAVPAASVSETWTWDDGGWRRLSVEPTIGSPFDMALDGANDVVRMTARLLDGPLRNFVHDGRAWRAVVSTSTVTLGLVQRGGLTYDEQRQQLVVLTSAYEAGVGVTGANLWAWDGSAWASIWSGSELVFGSLAHQSGPNRYVAIGGSDTALMTWIFEGGTWTLLPAQPALGLRGHFAQDPRRDRLYVLGTLGAAFDLSELVGTTWIQRPTVGVAPDRRIGHRPTYDRRRRRVVLPVSFLEPSTVHTLDVDPDNRPAVVVRFDLARAGVREDVESIDVTVAAGGRGFANAGAVPEEGAELIAWSHRRGRWVALGRNTASPDSTQRFVTRVAGADARSLVRAQGRRLDLALTSAAPLGSGSEASIRLDRLSVRIRYRRR